MPSTYSTNLALELIGTGDQAGTWGNTTNTNLGTLIEQAISGYVTQAVSTGTDTTITIPNGATGVARNMYIELTGTGGTNTNLIVPSNKKLYFIFNNSTGAVTVKVTGQTGVSVPQGKKMVLVSNGTDIVNGINYIADFGTNSFTVTNLTATSASITTLTGTSAGITTLSSGSANITQLQSTSATISTLTSTSANITTLSGTTATFTSASVTNLTATSIVISNLSISSANITTLTSGSLTVSGNSLAAKFVPTGGAVTGNGMYLPAANTVAFTTDGVRRVDFDPYGNVLVGGTSGLSPAANSIEVSINNPLTVSNGGSVLAFGAQGSLTGYVYADSSSNVEINSTSGYTQLSTSGGTARLTSSGVLTLSANPTLSGGTANGVLYLNGSKVATSGSALTFNGTSFGVGSSSYGDAGTIGLSVGVAGSTAGGLQLWASSSQEHYIQWGDSTTGSATYAGAISYSHTSDFMRFWVNSTEQMRLTSTGLGIGTSSPSAPVEIVYAASGQQVAQRWRSGAGNVYGLDFVGNNADNGWGQIATYASGYLYWGVSATNGAYTEQMRLTSTGLGIGTSSPGQKLEVAGTIKSTAANGLLLQNSTSTGANYIRMIDSVQSSYFGQEDSTGSTFGLTAYSTIIYGNAAYPMIFATNGVERCRIDASGNLGIGTSSPAYKLDVVGNAGVARIQSTGAGQNAQLNLQSTVATWSVGQNITLTSTGALEFYNGATRAVIDSSGNVGIGTSSPSYKLDVAGGDARVQNSSAEVALRVYGNGATAYSGAGIAGGAVLQLQNTNTGANVYSQINALDASASTIGQINFVSVSDATNEGFMSFSTRPSGGNLTERLRLDSSGNLGIGTSSPGTKLQVNGGVQFGGVGTDGYVQFLRSSDGGAVSSMAFISASTEVKLNNALSGPMTFYTNNTERARITAGGDFLVGNSTANETFSGIPTIQGASNCIFTNKRDTTGSASQFRFYNPNGLVGDISTSGSATTYGTSSDRRLKSNIALADDSGAVVDSIQIVKHDWKAGGHVRYGVIAQDLHAVAPEAVKVGDDGEEVTDAWGVDYSKLVPMLVKEIQSLRARVAHLEAK